MIRTDTLRVLLSKQGNVLPLCGAAFLQSCGGGIWFVAIPYILKRFGATDTQLGFCMGMWFLSYLFGCLSVSRLLDRFNSKSTVQIGAGANVLSVAVLLAVVMLGEKGLSPFSPVVLMIVLSSVSGVFTSLFWPPLMGWVSTGYEGPQLNHRLGLFSASWSLGSLATPYFAGLMVERSSTSPIVGMVIFMILSFVAVSFARNPNLSKPTNQRPTELSSDLEPTLLPRFRWMARVALLTSFVCIGLVRTQLAVLFKYELPFSESDYGSAILAMSIATFAIFTLASQTHAWHYKVWLFMLGQTSLLVSMLLILYTSSLFLLTLATFMIGTGNSFMYASHLYYGVSGGRRRSGRMAIHETILSVGFVLGGLIGGILSDHLGKYCPYWFGFGVVTVGLIIQGIIWFAVKEKTARF